MYTKRMWTKWLVGLLAILLLAGAAAWFSSRAGGGRIIHFWMDDATGLEPGTVVNLSGVRAGAVVHMSLDADPSRQNDPRAKIDVRLTTDAFPLINPVDWIVAVTTSPLPGFKAEVDLVRRGDGEEPLPELVDGAWHAETRSAVTRQINLAFDALIHKLRGLSEASKEGDGFSLRDLIPQLDAKEGAALISMMLTPEQVDVVTDMLKKMDAFLGEAASDAQDGGFARAALGVKAHGDLVKILDDLAQAADRLKADTQGDSVLLNTLLSDADVGAISETLRNVNSLSHAAVDKGAEGGLARAALGSEAHDNFVRTSREVLALASRLRSDLEGDGKLLKALLPGEDYRNISDSLKNVHTLTEAAAGDREHGGLAKAALGDVGYGNLVKLTEELLAAANRLRKDLEDEDGALLRALLPGADYRNVSETLGNIRALTEAAAGDREHGGLAKAALGDVGYDNLIRLTDELLQTAVRVRSDLEGEGGVLHAVMPPEDLDNLSRAMRNLASITDAAAGNLQRGGLARVAMGDEAYGNLLRLSRDLVAMSDRLKNDMAGDGTMQHLLFTREDSRRISDVILNVDRISRQVAAIDLTPVRDGLRTMATVRQALDHMTGMISRLTGPAPGGGPGELEAGLAEFPAHLKTIYDIVEKASRSTDAIMDQASDLLRKTSQTVSAVNQILTGLKRSWIFRGAFNEQLRYEDLAPYLVPNPGRPPEAGGQPDYDALFRNLPQ